MIIPHVIFFQHHAQHGHLFITLLNSLEDWERRNTKEREYKDH